MWPGVAYFYARFVQGSGLWWHVVEIGGLKVEGFVVYSFGAQLADQPQPGHNHHWRVLQVDASVATNVQSLRFPSSSVSRLNGHLAVSFLPS